MVEKNKKLLKEIGIFLCFVELLIISYEKKQSLNL